VGRFSDQVIIVTGGASGIGRATVMRLAREGARVAIVDLPAATGGPQTVRDIEAGGGQASFVPTDVTSSAALQHAVETVIGTWGRLDGIMNNAGINGPIALIEDYPEHDFDRVIAVDLKAVWLGMRAVIPRMKEQRRGLILNTASTAGVASYVGTSAYTAAKHGVVGLTKLAAQELAPFGIRVNCICPAPVHTPMMHDTERKVNPKDPLAARAIFESQQPLKRYGTAEEVAALAAFLLSDEAAYITGAPYLIDGGLLAAGFGAPPVQ
jgi:3alpha(or 20beta)-hydroxysteroid dehydrogenase